MKRKELVGATLIGASAIVVGCVITTEKPADSSPPPTPPPPAPATAPVASAAPAPAPTPTPLPVVEPLPDAAPPEPVASATPDAASPAPTVVPKKPGLKGRKADTDGGT
jgi:hypothetical protein